MWWYETIKMERGIVFGEKCITFAVPTPKNGASERTEALRHEGSFARGRAEQQSTGQMKRSLKGFEQRDMKQQRTVV